MGLPEASQKIERRLRQRDEAIFVAFGVADMHARVRGVDIAQLQAQSFAQAQTQAIEGEQEHPVAEDAGGGEDAPGLFDGDDIGQPLGAGRFDQAGATQGLRRTCMV